MQNDPSGGLPGHPNELYETTGGGPPNYLQVYQYIGLQLQPFTMYTLTASVRGSADIYMYTASPPNLDDPLAIGSVRSSSSFVDVVAQFTTGASPSGGIGNISLETPQFGGSGIESDFENVRLDATPTPEPSLIVLAGAGLTGLIASGLRRRRTRCFWAPGSIRRAWR